MRRKDLPPPGTKVKLTLRSGIEIVGIAWAPYNFGYCQCCGQHITKLRFVQDGKPDNEIIGIPLGEIDRCDAVGKDAE